MAVTLEQVRSYLDPEEPDYRAAAAALAPDALPILEQLVNGSDPMLASKAAYLASLIHAPGAARVLNAAARNPDPIVRVAAAAGARNRPEPGADDVLVGLLTDRDPGVRSTALESVPEDAGGAVRAAVASMARVEAEPAVRESSRRALERLDRGVGARSARRPGMSAPEMESGGGTSGPEPGEAPPEDDGRGMGGGTADVEDRRSGDDESSGQGAGGGDVGGGATGEDEGPIGGGGPGAL